MEFTVDVKEIFDESDPSFEHSLKILAENFGKDITLEQLHNLFLEYKLPAKIIDGTKYFAGYKGTSRISDGWHNARLIDVIQAGKSCKLMFAVDSKYIYQTLEEYTIEGVVKCAKQMYKGWSILVVTEKIEATGEYHSIVVDSHIS